MSAGRARWRRGFVLVAMLCALALAGCGKKGAPTPPPGVPDTYPQPYPRE
jgi:predicted small lipoprotein YifL